MFTRRDNKAHDDGVACSAGSYRGKTHDYVFTRRDKAHDDGVGCSAGDAGHVATAGENMERFLLAKH